jgi:hypothetical protein
MRILLLILAGLVLALGIWLVLRDSDSVKPVLSDLKLDPITTQLTWTLDTDGATLTDFEVVIEPGQSTVVSIPSLDLSNQLDADTTYTFKVTARFDDADDVSTELTVTTTGLQPPGTPTIVMRYDFESEGSVEERITGDAGLQMTTLDIGLIAIDPHPDVNKTGKTALYLNRTLPSVSQAIGIAGGVPSQFPTGVFSIQYRTYLVDDGIGDLLDMRIVLGVFWMDPVHRMLGNSLSSVKASINGKSNVALLEIVVQGVSWTSEPVEVVAQHGLGGSGPKVITIVVDVAEARLYNNGNLIVKTPFTGTFSTGLDGTTARPLSIQELGLTQDMNEPMPGGKIYIESVEVFAGVLTGDDLS